MSIIKFSHFVHLNIWSSLAQYNTVVDLVNISIVGLLKENGNLW